MKNKKIMFIIILLLTIGFAAVSTSLIINGNISFNTNVDDFDVYFSSAILDGEDYTYELISEDKKSITYKTKELVIMGDNSILEYEVTNASKNYNANIFVECTSVSEEITLTHLPEIQIIEAGKVGNGTIKVELNKTVVDERELTFTCTLNVNAEERTSLGEDVVVNNDTYAISGNYVDEFGNAIANANLVIFSETPSYVTTDANGYIFYNGLERGRHEIYYVADTLDNIKLMTKDEIKDVAVTSGSFTTTSKGDLKFENNSKITNSEIITSKEYCEPLVGTEWKYSYTKSIKELEVICKGTYKLEVWGAQGGYGYFNNYYVYGGKGGYSQGEIVVEPYTKFYIVVGGQGGSTSSYGNYEVATGGYNGGAQGSNHTYTHINGAGGGATHIALRTGLLSKLANYKEDVLIVAGGGGGGHNHASSQYIATGGVGGGYEPTGAGAGSYTFGAGTARDGCAGGGAGYYGGYSGNNNVSAGGGSGYIEGLLNATTINGNATIPNKSGSGTTTGNSGNGYAKITLVSID